ncbi:MAG: SRPBCC domain-containing protein [Bacteroidota bacterium]|jgi:hypothetical protein
MQQKSFSCSITVPISVPDAFQRIAQVSQWWSENIEGDFQQLCDTFTIRFNFGDSFVLTVADIVKDKKIVWSVTDSNLTWIKNNKEWIGTKIVFDMSNENNFTQITFTHSGLVPDLECYDGCAKGWNYYIQESLFKLLTEGKGFPDRKK